MLVDEGQIIAEPCPNCQSAATQYDRAFGFWKCESCSTVWGHDKDDPDYEELSECETCYGDRMVPTEAGYDSCPTCGGSGYA